MEDLVFSAAKAGNMGRFDKIPVEKAVEDVHNCGENKIAAKIMVNRSLWVKWSKKLEVGKAGRQTRFFH